MKITPSKQGGKNYAILTSTLGNVLTNQKNVDFTYQKLEINILGGSTEMYNMVGW